MHMGPAETKAFFTELDVSALSAAHELIIFPPTVSLALAAREAARDPRVQLGVQNLYWEDRGAFTGEVSGPLARDAGATFALVGHSERRHVFGESDEETALKVQAANRAGLVPVLCVGETLDERRADRVDEVILRQLVAALPHLGVDGARYLVAYEPVWAIGTGETATPADASAAHGTLRRRLEEARGIAEATRVPLLYGGSVKPANASELLSAQNVDGVLVGGASLEADSFMGIAAAGH